MSNKNHQKQVIIHISGSPGSGKSTLGELITKLWKSKVLVYDTDEFIQPDTPEGKELLAMPRDSDINIYTTRWKEIMQKLLKTFFNTHRNKQYIVLVGLASNFSSDETIYSLDGFVPKENRFFLAYDPAIIIQRFYSRYADIQNSKFWLDVSNGRPIIPSSSNVIRENKRELDWHVQHDYTMIKTQYKILEKLVELLPPLKVRKHK